MLRGAVTLKQKKSSSQKLLHIMSTSFTKLDEKIKAAESKCVKGLEVSFDQLEKDYQKAQRKTRGKWYESLGNELKHFSLESKQTLHSCFDPLTDILEKRVLVTEELFTRDHKIWQEVYAPFKNNHHKFFQAVSRKEIRVKNLESNLKRMKAKLGGDVKAYFECEQLIKNGQKIPQPFLKLHKIVKSKLRPFLEKTSKLEEEKRNLNLMKRIQLILKDNVVKNNASFAIYISSDPASDCYGKSEKYILLPIKSNKIKENNSIFSYILKTTENACKQVTGHVPERTQIEGLPYIIMRLSNFTQRGNQLKSSIEDKLKICFDNSVHFKLANINFEGVEKISHVIFDCSLAQEHVVNPLDSLQGIKAVNEADLEDYVIKEELLKTLGIPTSEFDRAVEDEIITNENLSIKKLKSDYLFERTSINTFKRYHLVRLEDDRKHITKDPVMTLEDAQAYIRAAGFDLSLSSIKNYVWLKKHIKFQSIRVPGARPRETLVYKDTIDVYISQKRAEKLRSPTQKRGA